MLGFIHYCIGGEGRGDAWQRVAASRGALQARARVYGEVLPGLQGGCDGLEMAEVVGLEGVVVASAERGSRLDHLRHASVHIHTYLFSCRCRLGPSGNMTQKSETEGSVAPRAVR